MGDYFYPTGYGADAQSIKADPYGSSEMDRTTSTYSSASGQTFTTSEGDTAMTDASWEGETYSPQSYQHASGIDLQGAGAMFSPSNRGTLGSVPIAHMQSSYPPPAYYPTIPRQYVKGEYFPQQASDNAAALAPPAASLTGSSGSGNRQKYDCHYKGCSKTFARAADAERHVKQVHRPEEDKESFLCDSPRCDRAHKPFHRFDHFREHLREYHKEDLYRRNKTEEPSWLATRNIKPEWWRCRGCLQRVMSAFGVEAAWECGNCGTKCEQERQDARQTMYDNQAVAEQQAHYQGYYEQQTMPEFDEQQLDQEAPWAN